MARGKDVIAGFASYDNLYEMVGQMPWGHIENKCDMEFDRQQRRQIFECVNEFSAAHALQMQGAERNTFNNLCRRITNLAEEAAELYTDVEGHGLVAHPQDPTPEQVRYQNAFRDINLAFNDEHSIREDLRELVALAIRMKDSLQNEPAFDISPTAVQPVTAGLAAFIAAVLVGADVTSARRNDSWDRSSFEYSRWGVSIGPDSKQFLTFCNALFVKFAQDDNDQKEQKAFPQTTIKAAFKLVRDLITAEHPLFSEITGKM